MEREFGWFLDSWLIWTYNACACVLLRGRAGCAKSRFLQGESAVEAGVRCDRTDAGQCVVCRQWEVVEKEAGGDGTHQRRTPTE